MQLLIIRHAIAVPRGATGIPDERRPLTPEGEERFRECARGIATLVERPDALLTSPWLRARQTAEIAAAAWGRCRVVETEALAGGSLEEQAAVLDRYAKGSTVAVVGHEPYVSALLARILGSADAERLAFKKGGAALVDVPGRLAGGGSLVFFLPPKVLRKLGGPGEGP
jgi:phosphohistidine phosphatase